MDALDGLIDHQRLGEQAEHAVEAHARTVQHRRDAHDADIHQQQRAPDLERTVAFEDHGEDVGAARRRADVEHHGAAYRGQDHGKAQVEPHIPRDGRRRRPGEQHLEQGHVTRKRERCEHAPQDRLALQEDEPQRHQYDVDDPHEGADRQRGEQRRKDDRHAGGTAERKVVGRLEQHDGQGGEDQPAIQDDKEAQEARVLAATSASLLAAADVLLAHEMLKGLDRCRMLGRRP